MVSGICLITLLAYHLDCNKSNTAGVTSGAGTAYPSSTHEFTSVFSGVRVTRFIFLCVCFVDGWFFLFFVLFCTLCYLFFLDIQIMITPLVSSNSSVIPRRIVKCEANDRSKNLPILPL